MRLNKYLTEKWKKSFKSIRVASGIVEVFVNPSKSEFRDAAGSNKWDGLRGKWVRFYADLENRLVYVWHPEIIHSEVWKRIGDSRNYSDDTLMSGVAENVGGKWTLTETDEGIAKNLYGYDVRDWEWVNKCINVTKKLKEVQKQLDAGTYRGN